MKKRALFGLGGLVLLAILLAIASGGGAARGPRPGAAPAPSFELGLPTAQEVRNMLGVYGERVETAEREIAALRGELGEVRRRLEEERRESASALERLLRDVQGMVRPEPPAAPAGGPRFRTFEFDRKAGASLHIPAGSFGEATLLTGVFAPTTGEALPVLLRLDAALTGPRGSRVPVRGAFLVGKAQGDANSRRAVVQLETLSWVGPEGSPVEVKVNGWAVDDDGIQGLRGSYVWHAEEVLALSSLTGALSAGAEALGQRQTTVQVTPLGGLQGAVTGDPLRFAASRAGAAAFGRLSEMMTQRLSEIVPAIHVANGRRVTVALIGGVTLEGLEAPGGAGSPFDGLDR